MPQIPAGWEETTLGNVIEIVGGGTPKTSEPKYWNGTIPWLSVVDFNNSNRRVYNTEKSITEEGLKSSSTKLLKAGDLIISARGTVGALAQLKTNMAFNQSCYGIKQINGVSDQNFLFYILKNSINTLSKNVHGAVFDTITRETFNIIPIHLPPLPEQKAIAAVLSSFDDKIDLLRAENQTLEQMGQELFKEWFGSPLAPGRGNSPLGEQGKSPLGDLGASLPEGWRVGKLSEIADFLNGLPLQKYPVIDENESLPVIKIKEMKAGITEQTGKASSSIDAKYIVQNGDVLFSWSGSLELVFREYGPGALNQHLFKVTSSSYPKRFYYHWILYHLPEFRAIANTKATTMGHIQRGHLDLAKVIIPDSESLIAFDKIMSKITEKLLSNKQQIQSLSATRDQLLPKLMSGEVRVEF